mmetsp:Transcript_1302/g.3185  ORF Transcript_1302/g.3185 Transcript_1302/m.3185 type:complete len:238 (-) Transcript_1302:614-1327(-)
MASTVAVLLCSGINQNGGRSIKTASESFRNLPAEAIFQQHEFRAFRVSRLIARRRIFPASPTTAFRVHHRRNTTGPFCPSSRSPRRVEPVAAGTACTPKRRPSGVPSTGPTPRDRDRRGRRPTRRRSRRSSGRRGTETGPLGRREPSRPRRSAGRRGRRRRKRRRPSERTASAATAGTRSSTSCSGRSTARSIRGRRRRSAGTPESSRTPEERPRPPPRGARRRAAAGRAAAGRIGP